MHVHGYLWCYIVPMITKPNQLKIKSHENTMVHRLKPPICTCVLKIKCDISVFI